MEIFHRKVHLKGIQGPWSNMVAIEPHTGGTEHLTLSGPKLRHHNYKTQIGFWWQI
jgi:hypothetical protein